MLTNEELDSILSKEVQNKIMDAYRDSSGCKTIPDTLFMPEYDYLILGGYKWRARWVKFKSWIWGLFEWKS